MINNHVTDFLEYYCKLPVAPEYAILIKGSWGSGKSYLVDQFLQDFQEKNKDFKFLKVSLYGVESLEDIETQFFKQLHPILSSKPVMVAGQLTKGIIRATMKIDLDQDGQTDASVSSSIPNIKLEDYLIDTKDHVIVFDDLERSNLDLKVVLGYINYFVEREGLKVIIIAEEDKLQLILPDDNQGWAKIKEKLIGQTLEIDPNVSSVYDSIVYELVGEGGLQDLLNSYKERALSFFDLSEHNNLRSLRKSILGFKRLYECLDEEVKNELNLLTHLLDIYLVLSLEINSGTLQAKDLRNQLGYGAVKRKILDKHDKTDGEEVKKLNIDEKYKISFFNSLIDFERWEEIFSKGFINSGLINQDLKKSTYFYQSTSPLWRQLWDFWRLENDEILELYQKVKKEFDKRSFEHVGQVRHVFGIFLSLAELEIIDKTLDEVKRECEAYIKDAFKADLLQVNEEAVYYSDGFQSYASLGYHSNGKKEFRDLAEQLNESVKKAYKKQLRETSPVILKLMQDDTESFFSKLAYRSEENNQYKDNPVLQSIEVENFLEALITIPNKKKRALLGFFEERYIHNANLSKLVEELDWLRELEDSLKKKIGNHPKTIDKSTLEVILKDLSKSISVLEGYQASLSKD